MLFNYLALDILPYGGNLILYHMGFRMFCHKTCRTRDLVYINVPPEEIKSCTSVKQ